jgi:hypothetical protein
MRYKTFIIGLLLIIVACGQPNTVEQTATVVANCQSEAAVYDDAIRPLLARWKDGVDLALASPRMSLAAPIAELQTIRRDTNALTVPSCLTEGHALIIKGMDARIASMTALLSNTGDDTSLSAALLERAYFDDFELHITSAKTGQPIPTNSPPTATPAPHALKLSNTDLKTLLWQDDISGLTATSGGNTFLKGFIDKATLTLGNKNKAAGVITLASYNTLDEAQAKTSGYTQTKQPTIWLNGNDALVVRCGLVADIQLVGLYAQSNEKLARAIDKRIQFKCNQ